MGRERGVIFLLFLFSDSSRSGSAYGFLLIQMQHISLRSSGLRRKQNLKKISGLKVTQQFCLFFFAFLPSFFPFAGHFVGFISLGKVSWKAFRWKETYGVVEWDFHWNFRVSVAWFFDRIVLILVWFERSLHLAQVSGQSCPWPLKMMTSPAGEETWIRTGGNGRFRGKMG